MILSDDFIERVITPKREDTNEEKQEMISREFYGMEVVARFDEDEYVEPEAENEKETQ